MLAVVDADDKRFEEVFQRDCVLFVHWMLKEVVSEQVFVNLVSQVKEILKADFALVVKDQVGEAPVGL